VGDRFDNTNAYAAEFLVVNPRKRMTENSPAIYRWDQEKFEDSPWSGRLKRTGPDA
jgi:hypothetical protein